MITMSSMFFLWSLIFFSISLVTVFRACMRGVRRPEDFNTFEDVITIVGLVLSSVSFFAGVITLFNDLNFLQAILGGSACSLILDILANNAIKH